MIASPTWETLLHQRRVTIISSPLYEVIYTTVTLGMCQLITVLTIPYTSIAVKGACDSSLSASILMNCSSLL